MQDQLAGGHRRERLPDHRPVGPAPGPDLHVVTDGHPGPEESKIDRGHLEAFLQFAQQAIDRKKAFLVTHSEIFPGTFASTTETADWLLAQLGLKRVPTLRPGPMGTQQLSEVSKGRFRLLGYAGNSAPDHVDQFHALPELLRLLMRL